MKADELIKLVGEKLGKYSLKGNDLFLEKEPGMKKKVAMLEISGSLLEADGIKVKLTLVESVLKRLN